MGNRHTVPLPLLNNSGASVKAMLPVRIDLGGCRPWQLPSNSPVAGVTAKKSFLWKSRAAYRV